MGTLREDMEAASASLGGDTNAEPAAVDASDSADSGGGTDAAAGVPVAATGGTEQEREAAATPESSRARDAAGKFAKTKAAEEVAAPSTTSTGIPPPAGGDSSKTEPPKAGEPDLTRAPPSWRHEAREAWTKAPPEIQREVARRELEMSRAMSEFHPVKQFAQEMRQAVAPMEQAARARGVSPARMVADYARFDAALSSRDPGTQAQAVAQVMKAYGVDVEALANAIDGTGQQRQAPVDPEAMRAQIRSEMQADFRAQQQQSEMRTHQQRVAEFAKKADPTLFNDDLRHDMAGLIDAAAGRGVELSLEEAFDRAVRANPQAWAIVQQRDRAKSQATTQVATQKAMAAGGSIKSRPASPIGSGEGGRSLREDLQASAAQLSGRT